MYFWNVLSKHSKSKKVHWNIQEEIKLWFIIQFYQDSTQTHVSVVKGMTFTLPFLLLSGFQGFRFIIQKIWKTGNYILMRWQMPMTLIWKNCQVQRESGLRIWPNMVIIITLCVPKVIQDIITVWQWVVLKTYTDLMRQTHAIRF